MSKTATEAAEQTSVALSQSQELGLMALDSEQGFEFMLRKAEVFANSKIIPASFRGSAPDCFIAMSMANRMGIDPIAVMQNLHVIEGRPSWSSTWIIATINRSGRFEGPLKFEHKGSADEPIEAAYATWVGTPGNKVKKEQMFTVDTRECRAYAICPRSKERIEGPWISMVMAVKEGWYMKAGSKWQTIPDIMLQYRAASFFSRMHCPELLLGFHSSDELGDAIDIEAEVIPPASIPRAETGTPAKVTETAKKVFARKEPEPPPAPDPEPTPEPEAPKAPARRSKGTLIGQLDALLGEHKISRPNFLSWVKEANIPTVDGNAAEDLHSFAAEQLAEFVDYFDRIVAVFYPPEGEE